MNEFLKVQITCFHAKIAFIFFSFRNEFFELIFRKVLFKPGIKVSSFFIIKHEKTLAETLGGSIINEIE